jgi:hypothetical protein
LRQRINVSLCVVFPSSEKDEGVHWLFHHLCSLDK